MKTDGTLTLNPKASFSIFEQVEGRKWWAEFRTLQIEIESIDERDAVVTFENKQVRFTLTLPLKLLKGIVKQAK